MMKFVSKTVESIVKKGENPCCLQFFQNAFSSGHRMSGICCKGLNERGSVNEGLCCC